MKYLKMKKIIGAAALLLLATTSVQADEAKLNPWQQCGIGPMIFPENGIGAAMSNIIWDLGTTAVTSASASEDSCKGARTKTAMFINETYSQLEDEIVQGEGAHLTAMMSMMDCGASAASEIRTEVADNVLSSTDSNTAKAEQLFNIAETGCSAS
ncbi:MAG: hypothetical protein ACJA13_001334 [Paraglaciecola sp.]|jgi:hypothetical protein